MDATLKNFRHKPGNLCSSTALANIMGYYGYPFSEALCFGIGSGLSFIYLKGSKLAPSRALLGRNPQLELTFFKNIGSSFSWRSGLEFPWDEMKSYLKRSIPILAVTDAHYLPYYHCSTHVSGHVVVLVGYNETKGIVYLADPQFCEIQRVEIEHLARAMDSGAPPIPAKNCWWPAEGICMDNLEGAITRGILKNARQMLYPTKPTGGLPALQEFGRELVKWPDEVRDWKWCIFLASQVTTNQGLTSNGRRLYAEFLREAEGLIPALKSTFASRRMASISSMWDDLAATFSAASGNGDRQELIRASSLVRVIAREEKALFQDILDVMESYSHLKRSVQTG